MKAVVNSTVIANAVQTLSAKGRAEGKRKASMERLTQMAIDLGESIANATLAVDYAKEEAQEVVKEYCDALIAEGIKGDDLKKPTKAEKRPLHQVVIDSLQGARTAAGKEELTQGSLNTRMSAIRQYLDGRGAVEFDLWGNKKRGNGSTKASGAANSHVNVNSSDDAGEGEGATVNVQAHERAVSGSTYQGISAISFHLQQILQANPKAKAEGRMLELMAMIEDVADEAASIIKAETEAKQAKGKGKK